MEQRIRKAIRPRLGRSINLAAVCLLWPAATVAQTAPDMQKVLERLDRLEEQNRALAAEVQSLREQLQAARNPQAVQSPPAASTPDAATQTPTVDERLQIEENRTAELASSKVEAAQRFPLRLTGTLLFNTFLNSSGSGGYEYPTNAMPGGMRSGGATLGQTIIGLDYTGPTILGGGKVSGYLRMDFWAGSGSELYKEFRLRTAAVNVDWTDRSFMIGLEKPLISPRDPDSLAQVGISPLAGAGNLWYWIPQARFEQNFHLAPRTGIKAQVAMVETHEVAASASSPYAPATVPTAYEPGRPGIEGRLELFSGTGEGRRFEIASGVHHSISHVLYISLPSDVVSFDWLARPWQAIEFTGTFFTGHNVAPLGTGGLRQGFVAYGPGSFAGVHSLGGWGQLTYRPLSRLWFNFFSGQQDDRNSQLPAGAIGKNLAFGANLFYRFAPNVLGSLEVSQMRTNYVGTGTLLNNHYDLALAYLF